MNATVIIKEACVIFRAMCGRRKRCLWTPIASFLVLVALPLFAQESLNEHFSPDAIRFFETEVRPVLLNNCSGCHNAGLRTSGLSVETREDILKGGNRGEAVSTGLPEESRLIRAIRQEGKLKMPPGGKLTSREVSALSRWIEMDLPWPSQRVVTSTVDQVSGHWSFQPIKRPGTPRVSDSSWTRNPIDHFILDRLDQKALKPSSEAGKSTLIRRVYIDLIGLLPKPEEVDAFLEDTSPDAYDRVVDRLLESPHHGERWGRHWLDVARYADSNGDAADRERKIWMYREWVIRALNRDLPFDQFVIEQIAGDVLPQATNDQIVATGFHRNTLLNLEGGVDFEQYRVEAVVDRVSTTGTAFLGLTLGCARCHDHKFDPVSQREFYSFLAFFNSIDELSGDFDDEAGRKRPYEPVLEFGTPEQYVRKKAVRAQIEVMQKELDSYEEKLLKKQVAWETSLSDDQLAELTPGIRAILKLPADERHEEEIKEVKNVYLGQDLAHQERKKAIATVREIEPDIPSTLVMRELPEPRATHVMLKGDFLQKGIRVSPGTPAVLPALPKGEHYTRLDLARWLVSKDNPLTARVTVNRIWQRYFGHGIVETENDFGTQGSPPSHPKLLDWLASEFVARDWSLKAIHRMIVTSATYRQSSKYRLTSAKKDPRNLLLARQNRLRVESEIVRDLALSASGMLSPEIGGPSVFPAQPPGVMIGEGLAQKSWPESSGADRYRRGMYTHFWRKSPHPNLMVFDSPDGFTTATSRDRSNTPLQALALLNDIGFHEFAQGLAKRVLSERPEASSHERIEYLFRLCLTRPLQKLEKDRLDRLLARQLDDFRTNPSEAFEILTLPNEKGADLPAVAAWTMVGAVILNLDEFITRE